jgi:hypothetical protein
MNVSPQDRQPGQRAKSWNLRSLRLDLETLPGRKRRTPRTRSRSRSCPTSRIPAWSPRPHLDCQRGPTNGASDGCSDVGHGHKCAKVRTGSTASERTSARVRCYPKSAGLETTRRAKSGVVCCSGMSLTSASGWTRVNCQNCIDGTSCRSSSRNFRLN